MINYYQELWNKILEKLEDSIQEEAYKEVFGEVKEVKYVENNSIYVVVPNEYIKSKITKFYNFKVIQILESIPTNEKYDFKFVLENEVPVEKDYSQADDIESNYRPGNLNKRYDFNNFVVGQSNMFAFRMAMKTADQPGMIANPLYIFGNVGLGKTHLMQAVGNYIYDKDKTKKILYVKASEYVEDYIEFSAGRMPEFKEKYHSIDVLLIDDIQMLGPARKTQMEFFNLFDYLYNQNKQIVITSDKPANELSDIMDRLTSRFQVGLTVDISSPNLEHRIGILHQKLQEQTSEVVADEVLSYIASIFTSNIRELEGALSRVINYCSIYDYQITLDHTVDAIEPLVKTRRLSASLTENNYDKIQSIVANYYNISVNDLIGSKRTANIVLARHIAMYLIKTKYDLPYTKIGALFGGKDHSSIISAIEKIEIQQNNDPLLKKVLDDLNAKIGD